MANRELVVFSQDERQYALYLSAVERVVRVVEVTPLPRAPEIILGVINVEGRILPVVNLRKRFRLAEREMNLSDQFLIAHTSRRPVALLVEAVTGVLQAPEEKVIAAGAVLPGTEYVEGLLKLEDGIILIHDLETFLSLEEEQALDAALKKPEDQP